jgi:cell division transport system ATP-binding protein
MIAFTQVYKRYAGAGEVLHDLSFTIEAGELVVLAGPSGAGKSTVLKLMAALERPSVGSVAISGQDTRALRPGATPYLRRKFGLVFQDHKLLYDRTVFDNVLLPLQIAGFDAKDAARRVRAALDKVGLLQRERASPISLSGGEQQRLCIARAVVHRPAIVLADEPTAHLDEGYAREIVELFRAFNQVGVTTVIATHDRQAQQRLSARTLTLEQGRLATE